MIHSGVAADSARLRMREVADHQKTVPVLFKRLQTFGELEARAHGCGRPSVHRRAIRHIDASERLLEFAAVCARAVPAGTIESSKGRAIATPVPRRKVLRGTCSLVMNVMASCLLCFR
jgi:hypothetical protein